MSLVKVRTSEEGPEAERPSWASLAGRREVGSWETRERGTSLNKTEMGWGVRAEEVVGDFLFPDVGPPR